MNHDSSQSNSFSRVIRGSVRPTETHVASDYQCPPMRMSESADLLLLEVTPLYPFPFHLCTLRCSACRQFRVYVISAAQISTLENESTFIPGNEVTKDTATRPLSIDVSKNGKTTAKNPRMRDCGVSFSFSALSNAGGELGNSSWGTF